MITTKQIRAARVFLGWDQKDLARAAELSLPTIQRMETIGPERSSAGNVARLQRALESAGIEFIEEDGNGVGLRFRSSSRATN